MQDATTAVDERAGATARRLVQALGGRFSSELGIDVDRGPDEVERWFLAATLFGTRISAPVAMRAYRSLAGGGIRTIADVAGSTWDELVALLDAGGYVRYDFRTASRLQELERFVRERYGGRISTIGRSISDLADAEAAIDALPGWGPVTTRVFLRELRGVWLAAQPPMDPRAQWAAAHLGLWEDAGVDGAVAGPGSAAEPASVAEHGSAAENGPVAELATVAEAAGLDPRDLEAALVRLALAHGRGRRACPGGESCRALERGGPGRARGPGP